MTDIQPGDHVLITARVSLVIEHQGRVRVRLEDMDDWLDADRCAVIGKDDK